MGLASLLKGKVVMIPCLCSRASLTRISFLKLASSGYKQACYLKVWVVLWTLCYFQYQSHAVQKRGEVLQVGLQLLACLHLGCKVESVQLKMGRNWSRQFVSSRGFNCSNCSISRNSMRVCVWMAVCSISLPRLTDRMCFVRSGVNIEKFAICVPFLSV